MKKISLIKYLLLANICSTVIFTGCRKETDADKIADDTPNNEKSFIGFPTGLENPYFFDVFTNVKAVDVFTIKRDAKDNADLQKASNVVMKALPDAITKYNTVHGTIYELMPTSIHTVGSTTVTADAGGNLTAKFAPGDFQTYFNIKIDGNKFDLTKKYALAYQITNADGLTVHADSKDTLYAFFAIKNKYDGDYHSNGIFHHPTAGDRTIDMDKTLTTAGTTSVTTTVADLANTMTLTVNEATNEVTVSGNISATQPLIPVDGKKSIYDPSTKSFILNYKYTGGGGYRVVEETIKHN